VDVHSIGGRFPVVLGVDGGDADATVEQLHGEGSASHRVSPPLIFAQRPLVEADRVDPSCVGPGRRGQTGRR
jgi:hypothetical protein